MKKDQVRFIWGLGTHGAYDMINARKKLGRRSWKTTPFTTRPLPEHGAGGKNPTGVELWFNREFMACDLKIAVGLHYSPCSRRFWRRGQTRSPGVAGIETINQFHNQLFRDQKRTGWQFRKQHHAGRVRRRRDAVDLNFKSTAWEPARGDNQPLCRAFKGHHTAARRKGRSITESPIPLG